MAGVKPLITIFGNLSIGQGRGRCLANMIPEWERSGFRVEFVGYREARCLAPGEFSQALTFRHLGTRHRLAAQIRLWLYLRKAQPVAILARNHLDNTIIIRATQMPGVRTRCVIEARNNYVAATHRGERKRGVKLRQVRRMYTRADALITASAGVGQDLRTAARLDGLPIHPIPNTIITQGMYEQAEERVEHPWLSDGGPPVVLCVARLAKQKDLPTMLQALAVARRSRPLRLIVLGQGPERAAVERVVRDLELEDCVDMPGRVSNPYAWMRRASLLALSSAWEGSPNVLIEALALGTPVVSTDCPSGPAEILDNGRYGRLVPVGDAEALAAAILETLEAPLVYDPATVTERFTASRAAQRYLEVLAPETMPDAAE